MCSTHQAIPSPKELRDALSLSSKESTFIQDSRASIHAILEEKDPRLLVVVGPCSIHDMDAGLEYAKRLKALSKPLEKELLVVMRVYFEKPRTSSGWKGLIVDPHLNGKPDIAYGLRVARKFLKELASIELATATEFIDPLTPLYIGDLISWAAIGARTAESPTHRCLASGLPMAVGFKNNTAGCIKSAIFGMKAAQCSQTYLGIDSYGQAAAITTAGNPFIHLVLRGGHSGPNYESPHIEEAVHFLLEQKLNPRLMVDCSHGNSQKNHLLQSEVCKNVLEQIRNKSPHIMGLMLESHLFEGKQDFPKNKECLLHGVSITDACIDFESTRLLLEEISHTLKECPLTLPSSP